MRLAAVVAVAAYRGARPGPWPGPPADGGTACGGDGRLELRADGRLSWAKALAGRGCGHWTLPAGTTHRHGCPVTCAIASKSAS